MENATKALLIAAAVLVAILIISLGLVVYNMASETIDSVNFSGQEVTAFNDQFMHYQGSNVRGSEINAMIKTVLNSNMKSKSEGLTPGSTAGGKFVKVDMPTGGDLEHNAVSLSTAAGLVEANTSKLYKVSIGFEQTTGFVNVITVTE